VKPTLIVLLSLALTTTGLAAPANLIKEAGISGGLVAQVGSDDLALKELGERFHVRLLLPDAATAGKAQAAIEQAGLQGRFTAAAWDGQRLPFAERVLNALVVDREGLVPDAEARRVLAPRGLLITPKGDTAMPAPAALDDWTHYLYDASGNAVSKDKEVAPPRSFRWSAPPPHLRSHNYGASFTGLVTAGGRVFHFSDDGTPLFDRGGATERWTLVARDAFNGAFLWKRPLHGYGQPYFEDVSGQAVPDHVWRSPLSLNRRMVAQGKKLYVALNYRAGALSILDGATGQTRHEVELGGSVDEIIASGDRVVCRVRTEIPLPDERLTRDQRLKTEKQLQAEGVPANEARAELNARRLDHLMGQKLERVVAVDAASGKVLWQHDAPLVAVQSLAMHDGKVVFHNYRAVVALDAASGRPAWEYASPVVNRRRFGVRNLLGNLLLADGKALWASGATGGVCLNLADGRELWKDPRMGETGGFAFPTALRAIRGVLYWDVRRPPVQLADGSHATGPAVGDMLKRGHHIRCFAGKATERFLITPHRGAEFVDLAGDEHMVNDWFRGACSYGLMPANGLIYNTPDPCSCYVGARINGFLAVAATATRVEAGGSRIEKGPAYSDISDFKAQISEGWPMYRCDGRRTGRAAGALSAKLTSQWERAAGELTPATIAGGQAYVARKDTYANCWRSTWRQAPRNGGGHSPARWTARRPSWATACSSAAGMGTCMRCARPTACWPGASAPRHKSG